MPDPTPIVTRDLGDMATTAGQIAGVINAVGELLGDAHEDGEEPAAETLRRLYQQRGDLNRLIAELEARFADSPAPLPVLTYAAVRR